jgi:hypothetical protein
MEHLLQRPAGYYFRITIPPDLKSIFKTREIKRSLKTGSLCLAKERAYLLSGRLKKLFRRLRCSDMELKAEHIAGLVKACIPIAQVQTRREQGDYSDDDDDIVSAAQQISKAPIKEASKAPSAPSIKALVDEWFRENIKGAIWKPRTLKQYQGHFRVILQILGEDTPIDTIDHSTVRNLKDIPPRFCMMRLS